MSKPNPIAPEAVIAIDWSGRMDASGQRRHIWAATWTEGEVTLQAGRTRDELKDWLINKAQGMPRMVVGVDFCFSYPGWFVREQAGDVREFWDKVSATHGEEWLRKGCMDRRFWGRPGKKRPAEFSGEHMPRMLREADRECKVRSHVSDQRVASSIKGIAPKSPFQIGGAGAVGTGTLRGIPFLLQLRGAGFSVWPFDVPELPMLVEIYPRLLTGEVNKSNAGQRADYLDREALRDKRYRSLPPEVRRDASKSEDAFDALVSVMAMARHREEFCHLEQATEPLRLLEGRVWAAKSGEPSGELI